MWIVLYEDKPKWDWWAKFLIAFAPILTLILGFVCLLDYYGYIETGEPKEEALISAIGLFAITAFTLLVLWALAPRKYQILGDKVKIVLGGPLSFNIGFNTVKEARKAGGGKALVYWGLRFCTSTKNMVEIVRNKGMNVVITPSNRGLFLEEF